MDLNKLDEIRVSLVHYYGADIHKVEVALNRWLADPRSLADQEIFTTQNLPGVIYGRAGYWD
jgi:hypothetical protein